MENGVQLSKDQAKELFRSKKHFIYRMGVLGGYLLPPPSEITWRYIQQVLRKDKILIKADQVKIGINPPRIREFSVNRLWAQLREDGRVLPYFPDYKAGKFPRRSFFFKILSTVFPDEFSEMIRRSKDVRNDAQRNESSIYVHPELLDELQAIPDSFEYMEQKNKTSYLNSQRRWKGWN